jgi:hypothetical protein
MVTGEITYKPSNHRAGKAGCSARTCGDCRLLFLLQAGHGCGQHPAFPAPSISREGGPTEPTRTFHAARTKHHVSYCHAPRQRVFSMPRRPGSSIAVSGILDRPVKPGDDERESGCLKFESELRCHLTQQRLPVPSWRGATGSRERAPDDRLRDEAIQSRAGGPGLLRLRSQ